jgi:signal transduction histidine kinase
MSIYQMRRSQRLSVFLIVGLVCTLSFVVFRSANDSIDDIEVISDTASTTSNMVIMQRESLVFAYQYERWLGGVATKRDVQVRRSLLAQRLAVKDDAGVANGERATANYLADLDILDSAVAASPSGLLPIENVPKIRLMSESALNDFVFEARQLVQQISVASDEQTRAIIRQQDSDRRNQYLLVVSILFALVLISAWLGQSRIKDLKKIRGLVGIERAELEKVQLALKNAESELETRLFDETVAHDERRRLDSELLEVIAQTGKATTRKQIAEIAVNGIFTALQAQSVVFISLDSAQTPAIVFERTIYTKESATLSEVALANQSAFKAVLRQILSEGGISVVNAETSKPLVERLEILGERVRNSHDQWMTIALGDGTEVLGCIWIGAKDRNRDWSASEVGFAQSCASKTLATLLHMHANDLEQLANERKKVVEKLIEIDSEKNAFIANVNHELRTPLTSIIGYLELVLDYQSELLDEKLVKPLNAVKRNALRLQTLIENMLQVAKLDASGGGFSKKPINVYQILEESIDSLKIALDDGGVKVKLSADSDFESFFIRGDAERLEQVFINLISNAIKFSHRGGLVEVYAQADKSNNGSLQIDIRDAGVGIPENEKSRIFGRFFRATTARQSSIPGTGLGLSIVKQIVEDHNGTVTFISEEGRGSVFTVVLPTQQINENGEIYEQHSK